MTTEEANLINEEAPFENVNLNPQNILIATDEGMGIAEHQYEEIKILGMEEVIEDHGQVMTVVSVEVEGEHALLIDVNQDDGIDVTTVDANHDGVIPAADTMESTWSHFIHHDNLPDYTNDIDPSAII